MCGISGCVSNKDIDSGKIINSLTHRGPDNKSEYNEVIFNKNIFLGHNRLSIIDLSPAGNQPMYSDDRNVIIVYNGEIYNFNSLRNKYLKDCSFNSNTDTEVILKLYLKLGINFIKELNGDFAIALFDKRINKLFLVRDRVGVKPLYYYASNESFVFASEIKPILESGIRKKISKENIEKYFVFKYVPGNETLYDGILRLAPGSYLEYDIARSNYKIIPYWQLSKKAEFSNLNYGDAKAYLYDLVSDSVNSQLMSDVPVGNFLSGGIDSSIIALLIMNHPEITHYTARKNRADLIKEGSSSDYYYAQKLAADYKLNIQPVDISSIEANLEMIKKTIYYSDDLIADGSQIPSFLITSAASKFSTVLLSGMGADELFYGYAGHQLSLISNYFDNFPSFISNPAAHFLSGLKAGKGRFKPFKRYLQKFGKYYTNGQLRYGMFNIVGDFENSLSVYDSKCNASIDYFKKYFSETNDTFDSITRFEMDNFLVKNLHYLDRMCMANSTEGRVPFLDYRLVEFAFSISRNKKLSSTGKQKKILKDTFSTLLPDYIIKRRKAGFGMPLRSIFSSRIKINELIDESFFNDFEGFSLNNIRKVIDNHIKGLEDNSSIIYALISFQEWYKMFISTN